jgi:hypothetical protein
MPKAWSDALVIVADQCDQVKRCLTKIDANRKYLHMAAGNGLLRKKKFAQPEQLQGRSKLAMTTIPTMKIGQAGHFCIISIEQIRAAG